ncbi:hypothetical protein J2X56_001594 [Herbaspirillum sp. 1173]|uniref:hypothetical protein n=1 Tax=Herbaspirillum sp. 1173 TaxID=2817734 RepID=UPI002862AFFD|nr:hypothetical protein [Herbaspirillum sp. 1173]MDR6739580.1 hypothetical protein [Herbaspirillum sp. 1173]
MGTQQTKTELVISAIDKASTTLNEIGAKLEGMIKPAGDLHSAFGKLYDATGLGKVKSAVGALSKSLVGLGVATVGIGGVYAGTVGEILHFGVAAAEAADSVGDLAEKYQINAQRLQVFGELVKEDGGTMEDAASAMGKLKKAMGLALAGGKEQQQAFAGVGISMAQLKGMKPEEVIERMADAFKGSNKDIAKQAVLLELMGKSGEIMMGTMNRGADGIREKYEQMTADGRIFTDDQLQQADSFDKMWKRLQGTFEGIKNFLGLKLAEKIQPMFENIQKWTVANRGLIESKFDAFLEKLPAIIDIGVQLFQGLWQVAQKVGSVFKAMNSAFGPTVSTLMLLSGLMSPVLLAFGQLGWALGVAAVKLSVFAWTMLPAALSGLQALWGVMLANPIGLMIAGVVAFGVIIYKNWDNIVSYVSGAWDRIKSVFDVNFFSGIIQVWLEGWQALANGILGILKTILPDRLMPDAMKDFKFTFATDRASNITAAQAASAGKTEVGGTLKIQLEGAPAKVTELKRAGNAMDIDVTAGLAMMM